MACGIGLQNLHMHLGCGQFIGVSFRGEESQRLSQLQDLWLWEWFVACEGHIASFHNLFGGTPCL